MPGLQPVSAMGVSRTHLSMAFSSHQCTPNIGWYLLAIYIILFKQRDNKHYIGSFTVLLLAKKIVNKMHCRIVCGENPILVTPRELQIVPRLKGTPFSEENTT